MKLFFGITLNLYSSLISVLVCFAILTAKPSHSQSQNIDIHELEQEIKSQLFPGTQSKSIKYDFNTNFEELNIKTKDSIHLNCLLFKAENSKGVILYLHGSNDDLFTWGKIANNYLNYNYDVFMVDYRGYGKSEGQFISENIWYEDMQTVYDYIKSRYKEEDIIILGHSLGTAAASNLAVNNNPKLIILQAPFYNLSDWSNNLDPTLGNLQLELKLENNQNIKQIHAPIIIFHGDKDNAVYLGSSLKLKELFKKSDRLIILKNEGHNNFVENKQYLKNIKRILGTI